MTDNFDEDSGVALGEVEPIVRLAGVDDSGLISQLLYDFNREFDEPTPPPASLFERIQLLLEGGDTSILLGGLGRARPEGLAVMRFRSAIWSDGQECYLAELYVAPQKRGRGLGRALLVAAIDEARSRGADTMDLGTSESDVAARNLYESLGFVNRERGPDGPVMYVYERGI